MTPYEPRPIRFLELWRIKDWQIKVYGIAYSRALPRPELVTAAQRIVVQRLADFTADVRHYHVGFLGVHEGRTANFVFFDFWADENELHHHVFVSPTSNLENFGYITPTGLSACVWDLRLQAFERDAWVTHILQRSESPSFDVYLATTLNADV